MKIKLVIFLLFTCYSLYCQEFKDTVVFSHSSGVYQDSVVLVITNNNKDKIYYSDNGDYPKIEYKRPILLSKSTTIRVKNSKTSKGYTRNYLFPGRKISLPIVCLTIKPSDLYDSATGIYAKGPNAGKEQPYPGANFHKDWERVAYVEYIDTGNSIGFNKKVGVKIFGQYSASLPQKSFAIYTRKKYSKGKIKFPLFSDLPFKKYNNFVLRNSGSDNNDSHFRDVMMTSLVKDFNLETQSYNSCVVYLNGEYWGVYHLREKLNEHYLKRHFGVDKERVAIMKHRNDVQKYGRMNYNKIIKFLKEADMMQDSNVGQLAEWIDIDNYLDYNIAQVYFSNIDAGGNVRYWRERKDGGRWRWILYDTDFGFGLRKGNGPEENTVKRFTEYSSEAWPFPAWSTLIIRKLLENKAVKEEYLKRFNHHLNTTFKADYVVSHINKIERSLENEMPFHLKKWKRNPDNWKGKVAFLKNFAKERPRFLFKYLKDRFAIDTVVSLQINCDSTQGYVTLNNKELNSKYRGRQFCCLSYDLQAIPHFGYDFVQWSDGVKDAQRKIMFTRDSILSATFIRKGKSIFSSKVIINEVGLNDSLYGDYLELYNTTDSAIDMSDWVAVSGQKLGVIKKNTVIEPHAFFTLYNAKQEIEQDAVQQTKMILKKGKNIILFSASEEEVGEFQVDEKLFKKSNKVEFVNTVIERKWESINTSSVNKKNNMQIQSERTNKIIWIIFLSLITLITFTALFFFVKKKRS
ncbi:MAG: CotH kinase family protein [Flavobacteriales bacterium]